jgi:predicted nuclease of predicted toxin-antitoxin system
MKLLLDENLPKRLKQDFLEFEIFTVADKKWAGFSNGKLLQLMLDEGFKVFITFDKNFQHQQNFAKYPISVFVLSAPDNTYMTLKLLLPVIKQRLQEELMPGPIEIIFK